MNSFRTRLKRRLKRLYFVLRLSSITMLGTISPLPISKREITRFPGKTQASVEQVVLSHSIRIAGTAQEREIKLVSSNDPKKPTFLSFLPSKPESGKDKSKLEGSNKNWENTKVDALFTLPAEKGKKEVQSKISAFNTLMKEAKRTLENPSNEKSIVSIVDRYRSGNISPGKGTSKVPGTHFFELRAGAVARVYFKRENDIIIVIGISCKNNQDTVMNILRSRYR